MFRIQGWRPRNAQMVSQGAKREAPSLPNEMFRTLTMAYEASPAAVVGLSLPLCVVGVLRGARSDIEVKSK